MLSLFSWWLGLVALGVVALPYLAFVFRRLPGCGFAFAKPAGLLLLGYLVWILGTLRVVPNGRGAAALALVVLAVVGLLLFSRQRARWRHFRRRHLPSLLLYEALFSAGFLFMCLVRAYNPEIEGTEKPMDFALLNTAFRSASFPPADPWLSGFSVNYYYFGYVIFAALTHLTGQATPVAYNLALATLFGAAMAASWGLGSAIARLRAVRRPAAYGAITALLVLGIGNLEGALEVYRWHGGGSPEFWSWVSVKHDTDPVTGKWRLLMPVQHPEGSPETWYPSEGWWWWRATRVVDTVIEGDSRDYTITEFPFFSFLLGDLHPHVLAIPLTLLALALCLELLLARPRSFHKWLHAWPSTLLPPALALGALGFVNGWDLFPYLALYLGTGTLVFLATARFRRWRAFLAWAALVPAITFLLYAPFYVGLAAQLLAPLRGAEYATAQGFPLVWWSGPGTRPVHFLLLWAPVVVAVALLLPRLASLLKHHRVGPAAPPPEDSPSLQTIPAGGSAPGERMHRTALLPPQTQLPVTAGPPSTRTGHLSRVVRRQNWPRLSTAVAFAGVAVAWLLIEGGAGATAAAGPLHRIWPFLPAVLALALAWRFQRRRDAPAAVFALGLIGAGFILFGVCESLHIRDIFGNRMNTVFKLYYQAWVLLAVAAATVPVFITSRVARGLFAIVLGAVVLYPLTALPARTEGFQPPATLDGLAHLRASEPAELDAQRWLASQAPRQHAVVLEATGPQYSRYGRVSSNTGIPTVLGWAGHEVQWRGSDRLFRERAGDIDRIYLANDKNAVRSLLDRHQITHVYAGTLERARYPIGALDAFGQTMEIAYRNELVTIYKMKPVFPPPDG